MRGSLPGDPFLLRSISIAIRSAGMSLSWGLRFIKVSSLGVHFSGDPHRKGPVSQGSFRRGPVSRMSFSQGSFRGGPFPRCLFRGSMPRGQWSRGRLNLRHARSPECQQEPGFGRGAGYCIMNAVVQAERAKRWSSVSSVVKKRRKKMRKKKHKKLLKRTRWQRRNK